MFKEAETRYFGEVINDRGEAVANQTEVGTVMTHQELGDLNREQAKLDGQEIAAAAARKREQEETDEIIAKLHRGE